MTKVQWRQLDGEGGRIERGLCLLLHRRYPHGWDRAASSGDRGIDFYVPIEGEDSYHIWQIKSFAFLDASRRGQIKSSLDRLLRSQVEVRSWHLLSPLPRTVEAEDWFKELTKDCTFDCFLETAVECDSLASDFESATRYAFFDDHERLIDLVGKAKEILDSPIGDASQVGEQLGLVVNSLNLIDPHYEYFFQTSKEQPSRDSLFATKGLVFAVSRQIEGSQYLTTQVVARYPQATDDRPIGLNLSGIKDALKLNTDGYVSLNAQFSADLPGGLSPADGASVHVHLTPLPDPDQRAAPYLVRLTAGDDTLAHCQVVLDERQQFGASTRMRLRDQSRALTMNIVVHGRFSSDGALEIESVEGSYKFEPIGANPQLICDAATLVDQIYAGRRLRIETPDGGVVMETVFETTPARTSDFVPFVTLARLPKYGLPLFGEIPGKLSQSDAELLLRLNGYLRGEALDFSEEDTSTVELWVESDSISILDGSNSELEGISVSRGPWVNLDCASGGFQLPGYLHVPGRAIKSWTVLEPGETQSLVEIAFSNRTSRRPHWHYVDKT